MNPEISRFGFRLWPALTKKCYSLATVFLLLPLAAAAQISMPRLTNGNWTFSYPGIPGFSYIVEWAATLNPPAWTPLKTNDTDLYGLATFTDAPTESQKFYRVRSGNFVPPLVYGVEFTGAGFPAPPLPTLGNLPLIQPLPDPFAWANDPFGSTRSTNFTDWSRRRAEIKAQIENYEIGTKFAVNPTNLSGRYLGGILLVRVTNWVAGIPKVLVMTCSVSLPAGAGPFPVVIGMNSPNGSINSALLTSRNIARITFSHDQITTYNNPQNSDPYYQLYPNLNIDSTGQYSAWAWGVSRIIDGLQKAQGTLPIDLKHIAVTGCSYAGKMALIAGAFDERIALTIAQESGGGGVPNWRYSQTEATGSVEGLAQTSHQWFSEGMFQFANANVSYLPEDHHMLAAMILPRALFATGNPDYGWLSNPSCYVSCRAIEQIYNTFGIGDRFGYNINGAHAHCATTTTIDNEMGAFLDKFMLGITNVNTAIRDYPAGYSSVDYARWTSWWGTTNAVFPTNANPYSLTFETECATVGTNWNIVTDASASNGKYVTVKPGVESIAAAPANSWDWVTVPFNLTNNASANFTVYGRLNCPTANDDSFYVKMDNGSWVTLNGLVTSGWQWTQLNTYALTAGAHTLYIGYREDGALLDKISISDYSFAPVGTGQPAENLCP